MRNQSEAETTSAWQRRIFVVAWMTYASLYLGRVNIAVALPSLQADLGWTKSQAGLIGSAFFWIYACGQLINGSLGDRLNPRLFVTLGLVSSAILNLCFGFSNQLWLMLILWGLNGYVQSTGWGPIMRVLTNWFGPKQRGKITALFGPCYAAGHVTSWLLAGWLVSRYSWRAAFWMPAALLAISTVFWWTRARSSPSEAGLTPASEPHTDRATAPRLREMLGAVLAYVREHPQLQQAALACMCLGVVKESFSLWIPTYLVETQGFDITQAAGYAVWLPLLGAGGIFSAGWLSHRFYKSREAPLVSLMLGILTIAILAYRPVVQQLGVAAIPFSLGLIGAMIYGANGLLLTALPMTHGQQGRVSTVAGFLDFASYVGSGAGGTITGLLVDRWQWSTAFWFWSIMASLGCLIMYRLASRSRQHIKESSI